MSALLAPRINDDIKTAMKASDKERLSALRLIKSSLMKKEMDVGATLDAAQEVAVLQAMVKQRKESIDQFRSAGRDELIATEQSEIDVIVTYLPAALSADEVEKLIRESITETGATGLAQQGAVMKVLMPKLAGRADGKVVSDLVRKLLAA
jgi:uncharacterized protein